MADRKASRAAVLLPFAWGVGVLSLALALALGGGAPAPEASLPPEPEPAPQLPAVAAAPPPAPALPPPPPPAPRGRVVEGTIEAGQTLSRALRSRGIDHALVHGIATGMAPVFNFRYARPGDRFLLEVTKGENPELLRFDYFRSALEVYSLTRRDGELVPERHEPELVRRRTRIAGVVSTTLYDAIAALGERPQVANDFAAIFAWDLDFSRSVQPGDEFSIVYDRLYLDTPDGPYVRPGTIHAARYRHGDTEHTALYYEMEEGRGGYYRPDGASVERQFLRAPLNYSRISSRYSMSRMHPILKVRRPHPGIDYAAPTGTPVWAVARGTVSYKGWAGGYGRLVKVRHDNGFESYYGHLSRYGRIRVGDRVDQKQVVGYVGASGLATGPHLDFRLKQHGNWVNPARLRMPAGPPIPEDYQPAFESLRNALLAELSPSPLVLTNEAL